MNDHIFVVGNSRSGTTMLAKILGKSAQGCDLSELHFLEQVVTGKDFGSSKKFSDTESLTIGSKLFAVVRDGYFYGKANQEISYEAEKILERHPNWPNLTASEIYHCITVNAVKSADKSKPIDQTPRNVFYIEEILSALPSSKIVCMTRDPRDICLSQKGKWKRRFFGANIPLMESLRAWSNYHPYITTKIWNGAVLAGKNAAKYQNVMIVKYEDFVLNPEIILEKICKHCSLEYNISMLRVEQVGSSQRVDDNSKKGVDASRIGTWESGGLAKSEISICEATAGKILNEAGYFPSNVKVSLLNTLFIWIILPLKLFLSLILNVNKIKNINDWFLKRLIQKK